MVFSLDFNINLDDLINEKYENEKYENHEKRIYQSKLRKDAIERYYGKCVISGEDKHKLLEVAHIKAVKDCESINEKKDINNNLLMWIDLHKYFDDYSFSINPKSFKIEVDHRSDDNLWLMKYNGVKLNYVNTDMTKYIEYHYSEFLKILK